MTFSSHRFLWRFLMLVFCVTVYQQAMAGQVQMSVRSHSVDLKTALNRVLVVNIDKSESVVRSTSSLESLTRTLNALQPSFLMGFSHLADETPLSTSQVALFLEIRQKILATNPRCKFAVTLSVANYLTPAELLNKLQEITTKLNPDAIHLVVSSNNEVVSLTAMLKGIEFAHAHGELVFYEGPSTMIPDGIDCFVMKASNGEVHRDEINNFKMKHHLPIIVRVSSVLHSQDPKRILLLTHLAEEQVSFGYHLAYPIHLPQVVPLSTLSSEKDTSLLVTLRALMARFN